MFRVAGACVGFRVSDALHMPEPDEVLSEQLFSRSP